MKRPITRRDFLRLAGITTAGAALAACGLPRAKPAPLWAQKDHLLDLRPYVQADLDRATIEDWDPVQYKSFFTRDGRQYALPKYHGALYYNKDLFDQARVQYPSDSWNHDRTRHPGGGRGLRRRGSRRSG